MNKREAKRVRPGDRLRDDHSRTSHTVKQVVTEPWDQGARQPLTITIDDLQWGLKLPLFKMTDGKLIAYQLCSRVNK